MQPARLPLQVVASNDAKGCRNAGEGAAGLSKTEKLKWGRVRSDPVKRRRSRSIFLLAVFFIAAGLLHFVMPGKYEGIIPFWIPDHPFIVELSGVSEIVGGIGLLVPRTRMAASWGLVILLVAIFPANIEMLRQAYAATGSSPLWRIALWTRLPLQGVLIWWIGWGARLRLRGQRQK